MNKAILFLSLALLGAVSAEPPGKGGTLKSKLPGPFPTASVVWTGSPGWTKGAVIARDRFITCRHANTPRGQIVFVTFADGTRFETSVKEETSPVVSVTGRKLDAKVLAEPWTDRHYLGDIRICRVDPPFPESVAVLELGKQQIGTFHCVHRDGTVATHLVGNSKTWGPQPDQGRWLRAQWGRNGFKPGDSGLPWLFWNKTARRWQLAGLTSRVAVDPRTLWAAEAPSLGSKPFLTVIKPHLQK